MTLLSPPVSGAVHSQTHQAGVSCCQPAPGVHGTPALQQTQQDLLCQAVGEPSALLHGLPTAHPIHTEPSGLVTGLPGSALPRGDIPTELSDRVISPLTAPRATGHRGHSLTPQMVPSSPGSRVLGHKPTPGLSLQGQVWVPQPLSQAAAPEEWELLGTAASRGSWTTPGTGKQTYPAVLAGQQRVADGQSCPTAAWAGDAQKAPLVPPCFS